MKIKYIILLTVLFIISPIVYGGRIKQQAFLFFNDRPVTEETVLNTVTEFDTDKKIYYFFFSKKPLDNDFIRVQLLKINDLVPQGGAELILVKDYRLMKDEVYYHTSYFVLHQAGRYVVQIYDPENRNTPLARGYFKVR